MKKRILISLLLIIAITLVGCGKKKEDKDPLVGKWAHGSYIYTFKKDKSCIYDAGGTEMKCTYETKGDNISILFEGNTAPFETTYKIDGETLIIVDSFGTDVEYEKK